MDHRPVPAKITRPAPGETFPRTRLFKQLDRARRRPLVWVMGPPGAGKTVLLTDYLAQRRLVPLWYQVDAGDSDAAAVFHYLALAAQRGPARRRRPLPRLSPERLADLEDFSREFFNELYARLKPPFVLVFDNYQDAPAGAALHEILSVAVEMLPAGGNVVALSRQEPPASLARARLHNRVATVDDHSLRLTLAEAQGIARRHRRPGRRGRGESLATLHAFTHGWAAGLVLLLEQTHAALPDGNTEMKTPGVLFEYFANEVFDKADPDTRTVLLQSVFLPTMTARSVAALSGERRAGRILNSLHRNHFFTSRYELPEPVFQYHPLFREFLRSRAGRHFQPEELNALRRRTAAALEAGSAHEQALALYAESQDWEGLEHGLLRLAPTLLGEGRVQALEQWLQKLPATHRDGSPWLLYWLAGARLLNDPRTGRELFERAITAFRAAGEARGAQLAWCNLIDSILQESRDFTALHDWIAAFPTLPALSEPDPEHEARVVTSMLNAMVFAQPYHPEIERWSERALVVLHSAADANTRALAGIHLAIRRLYHGEPARATAVCRELRELLGAQSLVPLRQIMVHTVLALHDWMTAEPASALQTLDAALRLSESCGLHLWDAHLLAHAAAAALTADDLTAAEDWLDRLARMRAEARPFDTSLHHYHASWLALRHGDVHAALAQLAASERLQGGLRFWLIDTLLLHAHAQVQLAADNPSAAAPFVARFQDEARASGNPLFLFKGGLLAAQLAFEQEREAEGLVQLEQALALGRRQAIVNFHGWQPRVMARLVARALEAGIETGYARELVQRRNLPVTEAARDLEAWPWPIKIYTFGRLSVLNDDRPLAFPGKAQNRPLELLAAVIAYGGRGVPVETLSQALWPEAEGDAAQRAFDTTLHRLRKLLGQDGALLLSHGKLSLNAALCWVDLWSIERLLGRLDTLLKTGSGGTDRAPVKRLATQLFGLYRGPFLGRDQTGVWAIATRERLHSRLLCALTGLGRYWEQHGDWRRATETYERALDVNDLAEEHYQRLMRAYRELGRHADAHAVYRRCRETLQSALGRHPSPATEALRRELEPAP
jgi:ATP/maltotriose-dependent transcriptional regulator MalT/DNA-binding SARP family transcriptional activator